MSKHTPGPLLDTWGRRNRKLVDRECPNCSVTFRPLKTSSKYCSRRCSWDNNGRNTPRKPEGWSRSPRGYIQGFVWVDGIKRPMKQHRHIIEQHLGRELSPTEVVHHINEDPADNRIENLEVMDFGAHSALHNRARYARALAEELDS